MGREIFASTAATKAAAKDPYIAKGYGKAVILECLQKESDEAGLVFVARMKIIEATGKDGSTPNRVGETVGFVQMLTKSKYPKIAKAEVKAFVLAACGDTESSITADQFISNWEDMINYVPGALSEYNGRKITDVQAARGVIIAFDTRDAQTKAQKDAVKAGGKFETNTYPAFKHVPDQGDIEARIKELDATDPIRG